MSNAHTILCIGYGFNDKHVHEKLSQKSQDPHTRFVVAAKKLTSSAKKFLIDRPCKNFIAIEQASSETQSLIWMSDHADPITYPGIVWSIDGLYSLVS